MFIRRIVVLATLALVGMALAACGAGQPSGPTASRAPSTSASAPALASPAETPRNASSPARRTLLVDTDVAADDLVALAFLVSSPQVELVAITISGTGEAHCAGGVDVVLRLLDRLKAPDIPVACGREAPLAGAHAFPAAWREYVDLGSGLELAPTSRTASTSAAVEVISAIASEHDSLTVLTLGPLTNLGDALLADPGLVDRLGPVFVMGGALHVPGNLICCGAPEGNSVAEWNVYVDPHAANVLISSGVMPSFISLDGTNQVPLTIAFAQRAMAAADTPAASILRDLLAANPFMADGTFYIWDSLAAEMAAGYPIGTFTAACVVVEEAEGPEAGFTRPGCETPNLSYLSTADPRAAEDTLLGVLTGR